MIDLDGRTGEGGGQIVRIAVGLAAVTNQTVRISNIRGNRRGGGGLKAQHVSAVAWLAAATGATVQGLAVGSSTLVFRPPETCPTAPPGYVVLRAATAAASTSLILQAVLPFLVLTATATATDMATATPTPVVLHGGTHVAWAPSYDYLDQVLFPTLAAWFGIRVERTLETRGWATGPGHSGQVRLLVHPQTAVRPARMALATENARPVIAAVDATVLAPSDLHEPLTRALARALETSPLAAADLCMRAVEDSGHDARVYLLLVARTAEAGETEGVPVRRWGCDYLGTQNIRKRKEKRGKAGRGGKAGQTVGTTEADLVDYCDGIVRRLVQDLVGEVACGGCGDKFLQDQVVVFQALAAGRTSFWREEDVEDVEDVEEALQQLSLDSRPDQTRGPFGQGSLHAQTARWVTAQMLPVKWYRGGIECEGAGWGAGTVRV